MKLLTQSLKKELAKYPLYSQQEKSFEDSEVVCKFFMPVGAFTWYVTEAEILENGDYRFFGLVINNYHEKEWGYFLLSELESVKRYARLGVERDLYFEKCKISEIN